MASILVIDDDREFREYVAAILEGNGHEVSTVGSSSLLVRAIRENRLRGSFDAAVVDILMPEVSGIEVIQTLKKARPSARVVAITGGGPQLGVENRLEVASKFGAEATLAKPFSSYQLCGTIDRTLAQAKS
jgi:two-component system, chemotaxis family, chemotaxis protein CheY